MTLSAANTLTINGGNGGTSANGPDSGNGGNGGSGITATGDLTLSAANTLTINGGSGGDGGDGGYGNGNGGNGGNAIDTSGGDFLLTLTGAGDVTIAGGSGGMGTELSWNGINGKGFSNAATVDATKLTGALTITGSTAGDVFNLKADNAKTDTLVYTGAEDSRLGTDDTPAFDRVTGFTVGSGEAVDDKIDLRVLKLTKGFTTTELAAEKISLGGDAEHASIVITTSNAANFFKDSNGTQYSVTYATTTVGSTALTFVFIDADRTGNWDSTKDMVIQLTGVTGTDLAVDNFIFA